MTHELIAIFIFCIACIGLSYLLFRVAVTDSFYDHLIYYILACSLSEFAKRFIYIKSEVNVSVLYYAALLFPDILFFFILIRVREKVSAKKAVIISFACMVLFLHGALFAGPTAAIVAFKTYAALVMWFIFQDEYYSLSVTGLNRFVLRLIGVFLVFGVYGFLQFVFGYYPWEVTWFNASPTSMKMIEVMNDGKIYRAFSAFSGVQEYSMLLVLVISLSTILIKGWQALAVGSVFIVFLVSSGSKTTFMALLASAFFYKTGLYRYFGVILAVIAGGIAYIYTRSSTEIFEIVLLVRNALPAKISIMVDPITILPRISIFTDFFKSDQSLRTILIGHGFGASRGDIVFDNSYLMIFYETGLCGILVLASMIRRFFYGVGMVAEGPGLQDKRAIADAFAVYAIAALIAMFFSQIIAVRTFFIFFASILWWGISMSNESKKYSASVAKECRTK